MKRLVLVLAAAMAACAFGKTSTPEGWTDDYDAALKRAAAEKKYVIADFSGSDWCGWCKRLDREVFDTAAFKAGAKDKYVLLMVDSPSDKSLLSAKAKEQNPKLCEKYGIRGFPTVLVLDAKGEVVFQTGYQAGGPEKYLEMLEAETDPDISKYLNPIKDILNAHDAEMRKESEAVRDDFLKTHPEPTDVSTDDYRKKFMSDFQATMEKAMFGRIYDKYAPLYDKAFAEAKAKKVPSALENRKADLINGHETRYAAWKKARADWLKKQGK